ncbi:MAG: hypothetical protein LBS18_05010 [Clostridiales bacterium]|jgi:hypothetical protein|nr:hypothetical protein [Clostridiales bacterium]
MAKRTRYKPKRKKLNLRSGNAGPIATMLASILGIAAVLALIVFVALPRLLPLIGLGGVRLPWQPTPSPQPTIRPTPTPHPIMSADPYEIQREVELPADRDYLSYRWFADPYAYGGRLVFVAGMLVENDIHMNALFLLDMDTGEVLPVDAQLEYQDYVYPVLNDEWLVYLDSRANGSGAIRAMRWDSGQSVKVKDVGTGQPRLHLDGGILAWMERTGSGMDKLFVCDLTTLESVTVQTFDKTPYGMSGISLCGGEIVYAYEDPYADESAGGEKGTSGIYSVRVSTGESSVYRPETYVHNPMTNGSHWVWRDGLYGENNNLYYTQGGSAPQLIAENILEYGISDSFVAYSKYNEPIKVYLFDKDIEIDITPNVDQERTQLLAVTNGVVIWMDITSREREVMKYARME